MPARILIAAAMMAMCTQALAGDDAGLEQLSWLSGCWRDAATEPGSGEQWTALAGGTLLGTSRTVKHGKTVSFELMQIRKTPEGGAGFIVQPMGKTTHGVPAAQHQRHRSDLREPEARLPAARGVRTGHRERTSCPD